MIRQLALILIAAGTSVAIGTSYGASKQNDAIPIPLLAEGWSRLFISAGTAHGLVTINDQDVGHATSDRYLVVDLRPGTYEVACTPENPKDYFIEKRNLIFAAGEIILACDRAPYGAGWGAVLPFGAIGGAVAGAASASEPNKSYTLKSHIVPRPTKSKFNKVVSYMKLESAEQKPANVAPSSAGQ